MYWHIDTDIISLIVMLALYVFCAKTRAPGKQSLQNRRFISCLRIGAIVTAIDIAASIVMEIPVNHVVYHILMTTYFASLEMVIVGWFMYVTTILYHDDRPRAVIIERAVMLVQTAYTLLACTNPLTGFFFTLGPDNVYSRGPALPLMVILFLIYAVALFATIIVRWQHIPSDYPSIILLLVPVIMAVSIAVQLLVPGWLMMLPCYMICLVLSFLFLQLVRMRSDQMRVRQLSMAAMTDQLTGLYNRAGMEYHVRNILAGNAGRVCMVAFADIDNLKRINDTLGHMDGDKAIKTVADELGAHFIPMQDVRTDEKHRVSGMVARYGGDEFLVLLTGNLSETQAHRYMQKLVRDMDSLQIGDAERIPLHISVGTALGVAGADDFETLCAQADAALYYVKRSGKNNYAFYRPEMDINSENSVPERQVR